MTVGDIRAAANGDANLARRIARMTVAGASDPSVQRICRLQITPVMGGGLRATKHSFGWPLQWLVVQTTAWHTDLKDRIVPFPSPPSTGQYWRISGVAARWVNTSGAMVETNVRFGAFAPVLLIATGMWITARVAHRHGRTRRLVLCVLAVIAVASVCAWNHRLYVLPNTSTGSGYGFYGPTIAEAAHRAATPDGQIELARAMARGLHGSEPELEVCIVWSSLEAGDLDMYWIGWPSTWLIASTMTPKPLVRQTGSLAERRVGWDDNAIWWRVTGSDGAERLLRVFLDAIAISLMPSLMAYVIPPTIWTLFRGRRLRRWLREGRCLTCGYEVGYGAMTAPSGQPPNANTH
jgi:hypothetical protein